MATDRVIQAIRRFEHADQQAFGLLSGDLNPMHMDPVYARRTQLGAATVHGVHVALWAMETLAQGGLLGSWPGGLKVRFLRPVPVGEEAVLTAECKPSGNIRFQVQIKNELAIIGDLRKPMTLAPRPLAEKPNSRKWPAVLLAPDEVELVESGNLTGTIDAIDRTEQVVALFYSLVAAGGSDRVQALISLSYLVGMVCPGLYSIFGSIDCTFHDCIREPLRFEPQAVDMRFRRLVQVVDAGCIRGTIECFFRLPPVSVASAQALAELVLPSEFVGIRALVIGGSRGLGATTAKLLATGGAKVTVTYHRGAREAAALVAEAANQGLSIRALQFDVINDDPASLFANELGHNSLYYFATPKIEPSGKGKGLSHALIEKYLDYYLWKFEYMCRNMEYCQLGKWHIFYPSTAFIDENIGEFQEYCLAKLAGEALCRSWQLSKPNLSVIMPRLPKILTDQTASISASTMADGPTIILSEIRRLYKNKY
ncbi:SDR family NAD(P)-dependent oxidoreductase [Niveispirillum cyanobacteriorum]|uniref:Uncharacterized protein n=1 Tax=Niveispirillum cyanobacteriorum TaxID=1612173 RepID=A0A2K9NLK8_9PROT|nr:SDR family NAD(P)-dependent oxidoreductase [Niveispirillum cyanobacteriorum]AUN33957.1 hypothetical protein C0V82_26515 [Niveispirillum cyanobacteriorum]GGE86835.1 hypothetical protein GCM10011317_49950 [Niveispirillum cyanobacteriorum]